MITASLNRAPIGTAGDSRSIGGLQSGNLLIFADARIDDRASLLSQLSESRPDSDADLILGAYRKWGPNCIRHLTGDFAFVIIDQQAGSIFCGRDHIGARPLYYALGSDRMHFASNIDALIAADPSLNSIDPEFAAMALVDNTFASSDRTFHRRIRKLAPGHTLEVGPKRHQIERWWNPRDISPLTLHNEAEYVEAARSVFATAVEDRICAAERVAVHLSGGLDSSAVAATATRLLRQSRRAEPIGYAWHLRAADMPQDDESIVVEAARDALQIEAFAPVADKDSIVALLRADWSRGIDAGILISEGAIQDHAQQQSISLILSGWGGDEGLSFNGRGYHAQLLTSGDWRELSRVSNNPGVVALLKGIRNGLRELGKGVQSAGMKRRTKSSYLSPDYTSLIGQFKHAPISFRSPQHVMAGLIDTNHLASRLESWALSAQPKFIQYAYPLLDRRVMEFALSLPGHMFLRDGTRRWIMREMIDPAIPDIIRRNTQKAEPARVKAAIPHLHKAFHRCADLLEGQNGRGERDQYVDLKRLIADLRGPEEAVRANLSYKRRALQFLLF
ncbi:asparagine synthetase B family protein [Pontixanthobacter gangjinensis]|uniref:asparagine synthase (glutamine-hydrolyzing) n=1 Tax=Pontixanthobacter gangjinensis TaxID=1028742 RepID=A0A6I4SRR5_9SPHN|nr:asparagine synthase-related protein [Pontixanthobacter gangjinensis]MXO57607.1 hypothetical protein [Pontixanthobacter gangjinensis]